MEVERESVQQDPATGSQERVHTQEHIPSAAAVEQEKASKAGDYIWYIVGLINILLALRILFLLFGARDTGFASVLYTITAPFTSLFKGIFASPSATTGYFDTAALLAIVIYGLVGWGVVSLIDISKRNKSV